MTGGGEHDLLTSKNVTARAWRLASDLAKLMLPSLLHLWRVSGCGLLPAASAQRNLAASVSHVGSSSRLDAPLVPLLLRNVRL